jgi:hypothetical protein
VAVTSALNHALLIAAGGHGPGRHGPVVAIIAIALVAIALVVGLVYVIRKPRRSR